MFLDEDNYSEAPFTRVQSSAQEVCHSMTLLLLLLLFRCVGHTGRRGAFRSWVGGPGLGFFKPYGSGRRLSVRLFSRWVSRSCRPLKSVPYQFEHASLIPRYPPPLARPVSPLPQAFLSPPDMPAPSQTISYGGKSLVLKDVIKVSISDISSYLRKRTDVQIAIIHIHALFFS